MKSVRLVFVAAAWLLAAAPAAPHHAFSAEFDINRPVKLTGTVTESNGRTRMPGSSSTPKMITVTSKTGRLSSSALISCCGTAGRATKSKQATSSTFKASPRETVATAATHPQSRW